MSELAYFAELALVTYTVRAYVHTIPIPVSGCMVCKQGYATATRSPSDNDSTS